MTAVLEILREDYNDARRKRARYMEEIASAPPSIRDAKRKRLEEIYEASRATIESEICVNINDELARLKRRRRMQGGASGTSLEVVERQNVREQQAAQQGQRAEGGGEEKKTYDEETVRSMIGVALETQKEKLFEPFIEEHLEFVEQHRQALAELQVPPSKEHFTYVS